MSSARAPVVVGIDGSDSSRRALEWAIDEARRMDAPLLAVMCEREHAEIGAWGVGPDQQTMDASDLEFARRKAARLVDELRLTGTETYGVEIRVQARIGSPSEHLVRLSDTAQLVVVGARGYDGRSHRFLGSVVSAVTRNARCPVVVVP